MRQSEVNGMIKKLDRNLNVLLKKVKTAETKGLLYYHDTFFSGYCSALEDTGHITECELKNLSTKALCAYIEGREAIMQRGAWA